MTAAVLAGIFDSQIGRLPNASYLGLSARCVTGALADAGIAMERLDGLIVTESQVAYYNRPAGALAEYLGVSEQLHYAGGSPLGGATPFSGVAEAVRLVDSGICDVVAIVMADIPRTGQSRTTSVDQFAAMRDTDYEVPFGLSNAAAYALLAAAYQAEFNSSDGERAAVATAQRRYAVTHPGALYTDVLTTEDVLTSRIIASPLHLVECRPIADGGAAVVVCRSEITERTPVVLTGWGFGMVYDQVNQIHEPWRTGSYLSSARAYERAGITSASTAFDVALLYDSYTIAVLLELEGLGITPVGSAGRFVAEGGISQSGSLPTNTHGGLLSHGGPGICHITEAVRQLRGEAANQVAGVRRAVVHGEGGIISANLTLVLEV